MSNFLTAAADAVQGAFCDALDGTDRYFGFLSGLGIPIGQISPRFKEAMCDEPGPPPPGPPFSGGQCPGVLYRGVFTLTTADSQVFIRTTDFAEGPITSVTSQVTFSDTFLRITGANGSFESRVSNAGTGSGWVSASLNGLESFDGSDINDCGNPDATAPPFVPTPQPISFTYVDNSSTTVNVMGDFTLYAPVFAPVGVFAPRVYAPFTFKAPDFNFNGTIELPDLEVEFSFGGGRPGAGKPEPFIDPLPDLPDFPTLPEDDTERELIGVIVRTSRSGPIRTTELAQPGAPTLYVPRVANVYFRVRTGRVLSWSGPYDVKTLDAFIPAPNFGVAIAARVVGEQGWSPEGTQVFRTSSPEGD